MTGDRETTGPLASARRTLVGLAALLISCGRIVHPASVPTGWFLDVLPGGASVEHTPEPSRGNPRLQQFEAFHSFEPVAQLNVGYGWRFSRHLGFQMMSSFGFDAAPTVAPYVQVLGHPVDLGVGGTLSLNGRILPHGFVPGVYGLIGARLPFAGIENFRVDGGARWLRIHDGTAWQQGHGPNILLTGQSGRVALGIWGDYLYLTGPVLRSMCSDTCEPRDLQRSNLSFGVFLRISSDLYRRD